MKRYLLIVLLLIATLAIYALDHGIYIGSTTTTQINNGSGHSPYTVIQKNCRYLFVTGITEFPAWGGSSNLRGQQFANEPDSLYCRIFRD